MSAGWSLCAYVVCTIASLGSRLWLTKSVDYLLKPSTHFHTPRHGTAIAILVLYAILVLSMGFVYFRLLYTVTVNPGYVPHGTRFQAKSPNKSKTKDRYRENNGDPYQNGINEKTGTNGTHDTATGRVTGATHTEGLHDTPTTTAPAPGLEATHTEGLHDTPTTTAPAPGLEDFYGKDAFVCQGDGRPIWCSTCENWKPDRSHHCREIERCVRKMDHFCPWYVLRPRSTIGGTKCA